MTDPVVNGPETVPGGTPAPPGTPGAPTEPVNPSSGGRRRPAEAAPAPSGDRDTTTARETSGSTAVSDAPAADTATRSSSPGASGDEPSNRSRRRRGSRGGRNRSRATKPADQPGDTSSESTDANGAPGASAPDAPDAASPPDEAGHDAGKAGAPAKPATTRTRGKPRRVAAESGAAGAPVDPSALPDELPDRPGEGRVKSPEAAERALVRKPKIGDSRPAPVVPAAPAAPGGGERPAKPPARRRRGGRGPRPGETGERGRAGSATAGTAPTAKTGEAAPARRRRAPKTTTPVELDFPDEPLELGESDLKKRRGRERKGRPVGRYLMCVSVGPKATQMAVLEGRNLIEHYVSRPADDISQIHGNVYLGRVQNVLPGMEAAFIDIGTPKNAVLYRGDVQYDPEDVEEKGQPARIEQILKPRQTILCQVTKNPIAHKGARLTQEVSLPGRFVVLIPSSTTYGISKRLPDEERKRLRSILDRVRPKGHGLIVRTAADGVTAEEIERDVTSLLERWQRIEALAKKTSGPALLYREPDMAVRVIREELNQNYRGIVIDDKDLYDEVRSYVNAISPALVDRVQHYDRTKEPLSIFERYHVHEQLHRALDRKVWLPSGGSLIIEHTEALTVIDVNTGKNVGSSSLEETVFKNNLEAAEEIAKQLRLRDIGGIIVIDFIDMEVEANRKAVIKAFRDALSRDKTRTQVFDISDLGLVEMTRKRIGEGLLEGFATQCPECEGRGLLIDHDLLA